MMHSKTLPFQLGDNSKPSAEALRSDVCITKFVMANFHGWNSQLRLSAVKGNSDGFYVCQKNEIFDDEDVGDMDSVEIMANQISEDHVRSSEIYGGSILDRTMRIIRDFL